MGKSKKGTKEGGISKFDGLGVDFKCKLIGITDVPAARGDDICQSAMTKLKMMALQKNKENKEHKQKITVNITLKGIRILDETTERIDHAHAIHRISFISHDNNDKRTFAYIVGTKEGYKLFAIKAMKEAEQITSTLKELFQEVFVRYQAKKNEEQGTGEEVGEEVKPDVDSSTHPQDKENMLDLQQDQEQTYEVPRDLPKDSFHDWEQLNDQIQVMQNDSFKRSTSFDLLADVAFSSNVTSSNDQTADPFGSDNFNQSKPQEDFNPFGDSSSFAVDPAQHQVKTDIDFFATPIVPARPSVEPQNQPSDELYSVVNKPSHQENASDAPLLINDPFAELKKNINEMHKQNQMQQQQQPQFGYFPAQKPPMGVTGGYQSNPFTPAASFGGSQPQASQYQQPVIPARPAVNPFAAPTAPASTPQEEFGWTVTKPTPAARKAPATVKSTNSNAPDPFAFLDNQTTSKPNGSSSNDFFQTSTTPQTLNSTTASGDIFDLLG